MDEKLGFLTMDLENDCGGRAGVRYDSITPENITAVLNFLKTHNVPLTLFVTGKIFEEKPREINLLRAGWENLEFALHAYSHPLLLDDYSEEIDQGVRAYRNFLGDPPLGYRAPQGKISQRDFLCLKKHGFKYDASIFPTLRPGVFNNLKMPNEPFYLDKYDLLEIPGSVFQPLKIPLGLGYLRLLGPVVTRALFKLCRLPNFLVISFHLHDVLQTCNTEKLSGFWRFFYRRNVHQGFALLDFALTTLKHQGYRFALMKDLLSTFPTP